MKISTRLLAGLGLSLFSFLVGLLLMEVFCAVFFPSRNIWNDIFGRRWPNTGLPFESMGNYKDLKASASDTARLPGLFEFSWRTNRYRIRGNELSQSDLSRKLIVVLGDSQTFGYGLNDSETFPSLLDARFERELPRVYRVLNAGLPGAATALEHHKLKSLLGIGKISTVILIFHGENVLLPDEGNDLYQNGMPDPTLGAAKSGGTAIRDKNEGAKVSWLTQKSHLYNNLAMVKRMLFDKSSAQTFYEYRKTKSETENHRAAWKKTHALLQEIERTAREAGIENFYIFYLPGPASLKWNDGSCDTELKNDTHYLGSLLPGLRRHCRGDQCDILFSDGHYNRQGAVEIADQIYASLKQTGRFQP